MKKLLLCSLLAVGWMLGAADFPDRAAAWLAGHPEAGLADFPALVRQAGLPCAPACALDTTVLPRHKAKKVRVWGTHLLETFRRWGLDVAEFNPNTVAKGDIPDLVFVTQAPGYFEQDVEVMYRAAAEGVSFVVLEPSNIWSARLAKRLGYTYGGVLTNGSVARGGASFAACPQLVAGFPEGARLDAIFAPLIDSHRMFGMYLTGDQCLLGLVDVGQGQVATAIARYPVGRGSFTLVGPAICLTPDEPVCKRLLLNLVDMSARPKNPAPLNLPCVYHPVPREGKPYFELNVPGEKFEYLTQARPPDHAWHFALFFAWRYINGANFWDPSAGRLGQNRVVSHDETGDGKGNAVLTSVHAYDLDGRTILRENRTVKVLTQANGNYALDWTADFEALEPLSFTADPPKWNKEKGTCNGGGFAGLSVRLGRNRDFELAYKNEAGSADQRCFGECGTTIEVAAKSKATGQVTRLRLRADRPTANYTLHQPQTFAPNGFYFVAFPECFGTPLKMAKGEQRRFHYRIEVEK